MSFRFYIFIAFAVLISACTVSYSTNSGGNIPDEADTFSVLYFDNRAPLASGIASQQFTEALRDVFLNQTKLSLESENGDLAFEGYISEYKVAPIAIQGGNNELSSAAKNRFTMSVMVTYINQFDEKKNFERSFSRFVDFDSDQDFSAIEIELLDEVNEQLVQDIFNASVGDW